MKTINEDVAQGERCHEVIGLYAGAVKAASAGEALESATEKWIIDYLNHLNTGTKVHFKQIECADEQVVLAYDLIEQDTVFETIYAYPLKGKIYL